MVFIERYRTINHPDANIIFVGHSKGGAEAAANAVATNRRAILFNPAKANYGAYGLDTSKYDNQMTSYVVDGEILSEVLKELPLETVGDTEILEKEGFVEKIFNETLLGKLFGIKDSIDDHSIKSVIDGLSKGENKKWTEELKDLIKILYPVAWFFS